MSRDERHRFLLRVDRGLPVRVRNARPMMWRESWRADPLGRALADRHYNRQKIGAKQFVPPGRCLVLLTPDNDALWITSFPFAEYVKHRWAGAWMCSCFRNESPLLSSTLIAEAVSATRRYFGVPPEIETWSVRKRTPRVTWVERIKIAMATFVDTHKTRAKRDPGRCYRKAGWVEIGKTKGGLVALGLPVGMVA